MRRSGSFPLIALAAVLVFSVGLLSLVAARNLPIVAVAEAWTGDWMHALFEPFAPQHPDIVLLTLNEETLAGLPFRSPIDRGLLAQLLDTLAERQVRAVALDILFDQPTLETADAAFLQAARRFPAPLVVSWTDRATQLTERQYAFQRRYLDGIKAGFANMYSDPGDGTVRLAFPGRSEDGVWRGSLSAVLAESLGAPSVKEPFPIHYRLGPDLDTPAFRAFPLQSAKLLPADWLKDKIVLVGADLPFEDRHRTPFASVWGSQRGTLPGVQIQAQMLAQRLAGDLRPADTLVLEIALAAVLGPAAIGIAVLGSGLAMQLAGAVATILLLWAAAAFTYWQFGIALPVIAPSLAFAIGLFAAVLYIGHRRRAEGQFVREAFSRYVSPKVLRKLEADPDQLVLGGVKREVTVLFTDIEGFTSFAEGQEPAALLEILNRYLDRLCAEVQRCDGMVDKFIGDAVMAVFGAPELQEDHARKAVACACAMRDAAAALQAELAAQQVALGRTRIGLHSGPAVVGNVGGELRFDYTAIGDVVNTASRLEGANKYFGTDICVSGATVQLAGNGIFRPIGTLVVKGRQEGLPVFTPADRMPEAQRLAYEAAFAVMARADHAALANFESYLAAYPADRLARFHRERLAGGETSELIILEAK